MLLAPNLDVVSSSWPQPRGSQQGWSEQNTSLLQIKPSESAKVTADLQIAQAPGNGGVVKRRHRRLEGGCGLPSGMKSTEEEQLYKLLMEQRSAEAPLGSYQQPRWLRRLG